MRATQRKSIYWLGALALASLQTACTSTFVPLSKPSLASSSSSGAPAADGSKTPAGPGTSPPVPATPAPSVPVTPETPTTPMTPPTPAAPSTPAPIPIGSPPPTGNNGGKVQDLPGPTMALPVPQGRAVSVKNASELSNAMNNAQAGDVITLAPGVYTVPDKLNANLAASSSQRVFVRAAKLGDVEIRSTSPEVFYVRGKYWTFENLKIKGVCSNHSDCDNIFHVVGDASHIVIRNNQLFDYNAPYKTNADLFGVPERKYPHDVLIEHNLMQHTVPRNNENPTNGVNIDGGARFVVRANVMLDIARVSADKVSYAGFMKANGIDGIFERNLVICQKHTTGGERIGLSIGGGGAHKDIYDFNPQQNGTTPEWNNAIVRNNLIAGCTAIGFYNNNGWKTRLSNNTFYNSGNVQSRFAAGDLIATNNVIQGKIALRDGGNAVDKQNLFVPNKEAYATYFTNPQGMLFSLQPGSNPVRGEAIVLPEVTDDICGVPRGPSSRDLGAFNSDTNPECAAAIKKIYDSY